jgi:hypothetical protein
MKIVKTSILMVLLMAVLAISPAMAFLDETTTTVAVDVIGDHSNGNTQNSLAVTATNGGKVDLSTHSSSSVSSVVDNSIVNTPRYVEYRGFDTFPVDNFFTSVYEGQVIVVPNNKDPMVFSKPGDTWKYTVKSSLPVLAYVIDSVHTDKAKWDTSCAPKYDPVAEKFTVANLDKIYMSPTRSTQQQFEVTVPADESSRYSLVIDTRVAKSKNGIFNPIIDDRSESDSIDIIYTMQQTKVGAPEDSVDYKPKMTTFMPDPATYIGKIDMFPTDEYGNVITK